jgi:hypothetical protein
MNREKYKWNLQLRVLEKFRSENDSSVAEVA